jgi:hypothetical protein
MYYIIYKTINKINGKAYIGAHKTEDINDGYLGSGKFLKRAIKKYGIENFEREILYYLDTEQEMFQKEAEIVTEDLIKSGTTYNLVPGGSGGFYHINKNKLNTSYRTYDKALASRHKTDEILKEKYGNEWRSKVGKLGGKAYADSLASDVEFRRKIVENLRKKIRQDKLQSPNARIKRKETFQNMKHQQGENNSQFNTIWITDGKVNKKIKNNQPIPENWVRGRTV